MGWRFHRSIDVGGGFRINISKSGVGYSYGFPGYRKSFMPNGRVRTTITIPGTGLSYVEEKSIKKNTQKPEGVYSAYNTSIKGKKSAEIYRDLIEICNRWLEKEWIFRKLLIYVGIFSIVSLLLHSFSYETIFLTLFIIAVCFEVVFAVNYIKIRGEKSVLNYSLDEDSEESKRLLHFIDCLKKNGQLQHLYGRTEGIRARTNAGTTGKVHTKIIQVFQKAPKMIETNAKCFRLNLENNELYFFPDMIMFIENRKTYIVDYRSIKVSYEVYDIVNFNQVARDAEIIGHKWKFSNNDGSPDRRFKDNKKVPICRNGKMTISFLDGMCIYLLGSKKERMREAVDKLTELRDIMCSKELVLEYTTNETMDATETKSDESEFSEKKELNDNKKIYMFIGIIVVIGALVITGLLIKLGINVVGTITDKISDVANTVFVKDDEADNEKLIVSSERGEYEGAPFTKEEFWNLQTVNEEWYDDGVFSSYMSMAYPTDVWEYSADIYPEMSNNEYGYLGFQVYTHQCEEAQQVYFYLVPISEAPAPVVYAYDEVSNTIKLVFSNGEILE